MGRILIRASLWRFHAATHLTRKSRPRDLRRRPFSLFL